MYISSVASSLERRKALLQWNQLLNILSKPPLQFLEAPLNPEFWREESSQSLTWCIENSFYSEESHCFMIYLCFFFSLLLGSRKLQCFFRNPKLQLQFLCSVQTLKLLRINHTWGSYQKGCGQPKFASVTRIFLIVYLPAFVHASPWDKIQRLWIEEKYLHEQRADRQASFTLPRGLCFSGGYLGPETEQAWGNTSHCQSHHYQIGALTSCACGALFVKNTENSETAELIQP